MKIFLENLYHSDCYFLPIRDNQQDLVGVELITHFSSEDGTVRIPTSRVIAQLTEEQHWQLFSEQLELLKSCQHFFIQHKLFAWLNLTPQVATLLLDRDNFAGELLKYPFIELLINENYPHLDEGKDNRDLFSLSQMYPLVLGNLGAGNSTMKAVFDGLFTRVMLDKSFIQQQITHRSFEPFIRAIQAQISPCCNCIIAGGIDTPEILAQIIPFDFHALHTGFILASGNGGEVPAAILLGILHIGLKALQINGTINLVKVDSHNKFPPKCNFRCSSECRIGRKVL